MGNDFADRIAKLKDKKGKLNERLSALEQKAKAQSRKSDTRRKIIVGGAVLAKMEKDQAFATTIRILLGASVGRLNDRAVIADLLTSVDPPAPAPVSKRVADSSLPKVEAKPNSASPLSAEAFLSPVALAKGEAKPEPPAPPVVAPAAASITKPRDAITQIFEREAGRSTLFDRPVPEPSS